MNTQAIDAALDHLAASPGIESFAVVDPESGLVWFKRGEGTGQDSTWEAAIDYWRLHQRQRAHFEHIGELGALVAYHRHSVLAVVPCCADPALVMVALARHAGVDWIHWQRLVRGFGGHIAQAHRPAQQPAARAA